MTDPTVLLVVVTFFAGFGMGALWMDATRTGQAKDRRAARNAPYLGRKAMKRKAEQDWTRDAIEDS